MNRTTMTGQDPALAGRGATIQVRQSQAGERPGFRIRLAEPDDEAPIAALMALAIRRLQQGFLDRRQIEASFDVMGLDRQLIADGTYYLAEDRGALVGCGGWSRRDSFHVGGPTPGDDQAHGDCPALLDPRHEAARVRAMYTHPEHARRGIARAILEICEAAARAEGFGRVELMATLAGQPLYRACGYEVVEPVLIDTRSGIPIPGHHMAKTL